MAMLNNQMLILVMTDIAMERSTIFKNGKPSISIRAIYTMAMLNNQRVIIVANNRIIMG